MQKENTNILSALQFKGYKVNKLFFEENEENTNCTISEYNVCPQFMNEIVQVDENDFDVVLGCRILPTEETPFPFTAEVIITGRFSIDATNPDKETLLNENSIAILFPYLRSTMSMLVLNSNYKPIILPTFNIVEVLKQANDEE